jgi:diguanylate cyclase (GGDEF)-like protein
MLDEELMQAISRSHRKQEKFAVLFLDLDRFKVINDSLGHAIGDQLLVKVSKRILQQVRTEDTVARAGGDEFTIILLDTDSNGAAHVAQKILETVASPYHIDQHTLHVTVSIGISVYPENGDSVKLLKQKADNAMYRAKESERNMYQFFTEEMHDQMLQRMHLESQLHMAIERNELSMVYQPQLDIHTNKIIGAEALIRWNHTQLGFVSPAMFIPIAEESGQIEHIGEWVLNQSLAQLEQWKPSFKSPFTLAINLSAVQFRNARLTEHIITLLNQYNLGTQDIELEITESTAVEDVNHTIKQMKTMALAGIRLSLDDFGTGFSSLNSLKRFPINKLKVDKSFVDEMLTDKDDEAIVDAILKLADILEMTTLAEGVETQAQLNALQKKGCNAIQGYLFSRPLPPEDFLVFLTDYSDKTA